MEKGLRPHLCWRAKLQRGSRCSHWVDQHSNLAQSQRQGNDQSRSSIDSPFPYLSGWPNSHHQPDLQRQEGSSLWWGHSYAAQSQAFRQARWWAQHLQACYQVARNETWKLWGLHQSSQRKRLWWGCIHRSVAEKMNWVSAKNFQTVSQHLKVSSAKNTQSTWYVLGVNLYELPDCHIQIWLPTH